MTVIGLTTERSLHNVLKIINAFSKVTGYKHLEKSTLFLHPTHKN